MPFGVLCFSRSTLGPVNERSLQSHSSDLNIVRAYRWIVPPVNCFVVLQHRHAHTASLLLLLLAHQSVPEITKTWYLTKQSFAQSEASKKINDFHAEHFQRNHKRFAGEKYLYLYLLYVYSCCLEVVMLRVFLLLKKCILSFSFWAYTNNKMFIYCTFMDF